MNTKRLAGSAAFTLTALMLVGRLEAGYVSYLRVDDIAGSSQAEDFVGWSDILGYSLNVVNSGATSSGGGGGAGKAVLSPMTIKKRVDAASPVFFGATLSGTHHRDAAIDVRLAGEESQPYLRWELKDAVITSYSTSGAADALLETLMLDYSEIEYTYWSQKSDGSLGEPVVFTWNKKTNSASLVGAESLAEIPFLTSLGMAVPEPASLALLAVGACCCCVRWGRLRESRQAGG